MFINTNFTLRYQTLARIMQIYFTHDLETQLNATSQKALRRKNCHYWIVVVFIYIFTLIGCVLCIMGNTCIASNEGLIFSRLREVDIDVCLNKIVVGAFFSTACFFILVVI